MHPPTPAARGWRATVKDPFGNVLLILDRGGQEGGGVVEDAKPAGTLFAGWRRGWGRIGCAGGRV